MYVANDFYNLNMASMCGGRLKYLRNGFHHHHHQHGGPSVSRMTLSVLLICGYGSGSAG